MRQNMWMYCVRRGTKCKRCPWMVTCESDMARTERFPWKRNASNFIQIRLISVFKWSIQNSNAQNLKVVKMHFVVEIEICKFSEGDASAYDYFNQKLWESGLPLFFDFSTRMEARPSHCRGFSSACDDFTGVLIHDATSPGCDVIFGGISGREFHHEWQSNESAPIVLSKWVQKKLYRKETLYINITAAIKFWTLDHFSIQYFHICTQSFTFTHVPRILWSHIIVIFSFCRLHSVRINQLRSSPAMSSYLGHKMAPLIAHLLDAEGYFISDPNLSDFIWRQSLNVAWSLVTMAANEVWNCPIL